MNPQFPKTHPCGASYTEAEWQGLPLVGVQADDVEVLELRDCRCGSTLAVVVQGCPAVRDTYAGRRRCEKPAGHDDLTHRAGACEWLR